MSPARPNLLLSACLIGISAVLCLSVLPSNAAEPVAAAHIEAHLPNARLSGQGSYRWFGLKIYDAQLWIGDKAYSPSAPSAVPFALDLRYARNLVGAKIAQASVDEMAHNGSGTAEQRQAWLLKMRELFPDVHDNTHITGVLLPGQGARFYLDGKLLGEVADPAFADAFFGIWLNPKTSAPALRSALLTGTSAR
ncbi:MAG: chalcone isomerase family protein [Pseudomonadota bacterium]